MIVVAIVGILATVAFPVYLSYIQKSRVKTLVYPGLHIIESNIALHYAMSGQLPTTSALPSMMTEADTTYFNVNITGDTLEIRIDSHGDHAKLHRLDNMPMYLTPETNGLKIISWQISGTLAKQLGNNTKPLLFYPASIFRKDLKPVPGHATDVTLTLTLCHIDQREKS